MVPSRDRVDVDLAIVGGGIAGGALATVMARRGARVLLLERETRYRDHIRGEILWQWGLAEARRLGLEDVLLAAGGLIVPRFVFFDEGAPPAPEDLADAVAGIPGSLNLAHPVACQALSDAAAVAGADVRHGIEHVRISAGRDPAVRWSMDGREETASARLLVGADGRRSTVRQQVGIGLDIDPPGNCIAGLYVDGLAGIDERNVMAREADLLFYAFPQRGGRARLYLTFPAEQRNRLAGGRSASRFLSQASLACLSAADRWTAGRIAGPCATYLCSDARAERVSVEGVVLDRRCCGVREPAPGFGIVVRPARRPRTLRAAVRIFGLDGGAARAVRRSAISASSPLEAGDRARPMDQRGVPRARSLGAGGQARTRGSRRHRTHARRRRVRRVRLAACATHARGDVGAPGCRLMVGRAGEGNRTPVSSLGSSRSAIEPRPRDRPSLASRGSC